MRQRMKKYINEAGAIMLEVIAVLSLMGLMGTMLFRQIYQRNQELHNIQMASEIRVVKEAFSAWIQARHSILGEYCADSACCNINGVTKRGQPAVEEIESFLPDGYFSDEADEDIGIADSYDLYLIAQERGLSEDRRLTYYGVVVPKLDILPDQGTEESTWNFRRAARVAMLIGVDGGAYGPGITKDADGNAVIAGAVGTWQLPLEINDTKLIDELEIARYVALTGIDIYQPEVDLPPINVALPQDWNLALQNATAYGYFTVGGGDNCYSLGGSSRKAIPDPDTGVATFVPDNVKDPMTDSRCRPAFYVSTGDKDGKESGEVFVLNDLHVGHDYDKASDAVDKESGIRLSQNGMIVFGTKKNFSDDTDSRVENYQDNDNKKMHYMLDPRYTSIMNDVKLTSRGGARLSDILPNYILKEVIQLSDRKVSDSDYFKITVPANNSDPAYCPTGYKLAIMAQPMKWGGDSEEIKKENKTVELKDASNVSYNMTVDLPSKINQRAVYIGVDAPDDGSDVGKAMLTEDNPKEGTNAQENYYIAFGHIDGGKFKIHADADGLAYLYCVFPNDFWVGKEKPATMECAHLDTQTLCESMEICKWQDNKCTK